ncbi:Bifunctional inhibitor/lipid-transfer protein/seed storage 2S albumin superfamily protein [Euphorbia peplus]|nr:Bifunctional inhibitor/lipid-transfer protein/seed storage 2S albumin superfamily protein [Euphorbia peplus]
MGSKLALLLSLNLIFFFTHVNCRPQKQHKEHHNNNNNNNHNVSHSHPGVVNSTVSHSHPVAVNSTVHSHPVVVNATGVRPLTDAHCPRDAPKMAVCVDLLADLLSVQAGVPPNHPCCSALFGFIDIEAAICLCTTIKASFLGITIDMPIRMTLLLNFCGKQVPKGFICA